MSGVFFFRICCTIEATSVKDAVFIDGIHGGASARPSHLHDSLIDQWPGLRLEETDLNSISMFSYLDVWCTYLRGSLIAHKIEG